MTNVCYVPSEYFVRGTGDKAASAKPEPARGAPAVKGWVAHDPTRLDHDRYPRLRWHRQCLQCCGPKAPGLLRCESCNEYNASRAFLEAAERFLGGNPVQSPARTHITAFPERQESGRANKRG